MNKKETFIGIIVIIALLIFGFSLKPSMFIRMLVGVSFGYTLTRTFFGFAGSVNRGYRTGSTKLMRVLMFMFVLTAGIVGIVTLLTDTSAFAKAADGIPKAYNYSTYPINFGLIIGGLLFGYGMTFSVCCGSGVLTDLVTGLPRALVTLIFFGLGVFVGFPIQRGTSFVKDSWFVSSEGAKGVRFTDFFGGGINGYLGAMAITIVLAGIVYYLSIKYENKRKKEGTYRPVPIEQIQGTVSDMESEDFTFKSAYEKVFVKPWSMRAGSVMMALSFTGYMVSARKGWGVTSALGRWFGRMLILFGVPAEKVAEFSMMSVDRYTRPFFEDGGLAANFGIVAGTLICLLLAGKFFSTFKEELSITFKDAALYAMAGLTMGFGTRLANGCNAGALYTPITNFSLSGWIFLVVMVMGGVIGNILLKKING